MGKLVKFRRPPGNKGQFRGWNPGGWTGRRKRHRLGVPQVLLIAAGLSLGGLAGAIGWTWTKARTPEGGTFTCASPEILDGDTFDCGGQRVRLAGIDAPELPGHCRRGRDCAPGDPFASMENLSRLMAWKTVSCRQTDTDHYGRTIARCTAGEVDLSCQQIADGHAIRRHDVIWC